MIRRNIPNKLVGDGLVGVVLFHGSFFLPRQHPFLGTITHKSSTSLLGDLEMGVSLNGGTPHFTPPSADHF